MDAVAGAVGVVFVAAVALLAGAGTAVVVGFAVLGVRRQLTIWRISRPVNPALCTSTIARSAKGEYRRRIRGTGGDDREHIRVQGGAPHALSAST
ncbi:hypothetical protein ABT297_23695 [Dactylosporangium sp. NPDC000555]|uniref:hypothetical protein n=1 Tax=Dactylosporangium sp. NPDC000555 TaxID=3154260 RepID=UPI0033174E5D